METLEVTYHITYMTILQQDIKHTLNGLSEAERAKFNHSTVLITGCAGY